MGCHFDWLRGQISGKSKYLSGGSSVRESAAGSEWQCQSGTVADDLKQSDERTQPYEAEGFRHDRSDTTQ